MGIYENKSHVLGKVFSFGTFCAVCHYADSERREARNVLGSLARRGYIRRLSRNNYLKLKE
jgi:predicted transcriptional regulator of viral defense system